MGFDKVGHFVFGVVVKARMDRDGYLACIGGTDQLAVLPTAYADGVYRVHDRLCAAIQSVPALGTGELYPKLTQRSGHFLRHVCHMVFRSLIEERRVAIEAVATVQHASFCKIAVSSPSGEDPIKLCMPVLGEFRSYSRLQLSLIRYSHMIGEYIKSALKPAPTDSILRLELSRPERSATVVVPSAQMGRFLGQRGINVAVASRLTGPSIRIVAENAVMTPTDELRRVAHVER